MPTEIVKYVDPDGGVLADYTDFQNAWDSEIAIRSDLVSRDEALTFVLQSSAGSALGALYGDTGDFITDATHKITIRGDDFSGVWDDTKPRIVSAGTCIRIPTNYYVDIKDIQLKNTGGGYTVNFDFNLTYTNLASLQNVLINGDNIAARGVRWWGQWNIRCQNVIAYNINGIAFDVVNSGARGHVFNCIAYNAPVGYDINSSSFSSYNCIAQLCTDGFQSIWGDNHISDLSADAPGGNSLNDTSLIFNDAANGDFRLSAGSAAIDAGADLSATFNTDIIGTLRPQGAAWDIGAFELIQQLFNPAWAKHSNQIIRAL